MTVNTAQRFFIAGLLTALTGFFLPSANATSLSLGADYLLRGVSIEPHEKALEGMDYYDQRLQAYLITDLSQDVEATVRIQSITPWGLENSTTPLTTRYPDANGNLFVQNAFVRLPNIWKERIVLTVGRQPIRWGDGTILSDDELGFNALRAQIKSPIRWLDFDLEGFTAKINEGLNLPGDADLHGAMLGFNRDVWRWEFMGLWEDSKQSQLYEQGAETAPVNANRIQRQIYGARAITNLRDAYVKGEYYVQTGDVMRGTEKIELGGSGFVVGLGGKKNNDKFGRFGAVAEYAEGSGDDPKTEFKDEAFRPTFASRWDGLERKGYGKYYSTTLSDAYSASQPFAPVNSVNDGLPAGTSGIQSIHFGIEATPWSKWTFTFDYFQYKALRRTVLEEVGFTGKKELGVEFNYGFIYRFSGLVTVRGMMSDFDPGEAYPVDTQNKAKNSSVELEIRF